MRETRIFHHAALLCFYYSVFQFRDSRSRSVATHAVAFKSVGFYKVGHLSSGFPLSIALGLYGPRPQLMLLYSLIFVPSSTVITDIAATVLFPSLHTLQVIFLSRFQDRLTCSFTRYCSLFLGTTTLTAAPVFSSTAIRDVSADRIMPK